VNVEHYRFGGKFIGWSFVESGPPKAQLETCNQAANERIESVRSNFHRGLRGEFSSGIKSWSSHIQTPVVANETRRMF
jgi:hypothetical protein